MKWTFDTYEVLQCTFFWQVPVGGYRNVNYNALSISKTSSPVSNYTSNVFRSTNDILLRHMNELMEQ